MRSTSMTNLSRLSDVPNKPVNIVYLQSGANNGGGGSPSYISNNGYRDRDRDPYQSQDYHSQAMTLPSSGRPFTTPPSQSTQGRPQYHNHPAEDQYRSQQPQYSQPHSRRDPNYSPQQPHLSQQPAEDFDTEDLAAQLAAIRQKLEDKRKRIEMEKGRMETIASKQQFKLGKAAYLKAINKVSPYFQTFTHTGLWYI